MNFGLSFMQNIHTAHNMMNEGMFGAQHFDSAAIGLLGGLLRQLKSN